MPSILFANSAVIVSSGSGKESKKTAGARGPANTHSSTLTSGTSSVNTHHPRSGSFRDVDASHTGVVVVGLADIDTLEECERIRKERGAEGAVFDPALIYYLARSYSLAHTLHGSEEATTR